ncbi:sensor domain-containing diguanylate cyclase [Lacticigenium naphthae]|uniref:sensor domain-containing diguanylate cyclase n=1 Tax=Lacticigenium naphthae TaxID=515351 RepID=UPI0004841D94|nr:sensor domain-containing diguanylate cyclase [Lacticigenium naphthae]
MKVKDAVKLMKYKALSLLLATLLAVFLLLPVRSLRMEHKKHAEYTEKELARKELISVKDAIQLDLNTSLQYAEFLELFIQNNQEPTQAELVKVAQLLRNDHHAIDSVSLAKNGEVSFVYPLQGNEAALGMDLLSDPTRRDAVMEAIEERTAVAQGPVRSKAGGNKIFNRQPIYIGEEEEKFWGIATVALDFDDLLERNGIEKQQGDYYLALKIEENATDNVTNVIWGYPYIFDKDALKETISLPNESWTVAIYPREGWAGIKTFFVREMVFYYALILLIFIFMYKFSQSFFEKREQAQMDLLTQTLNKQTFENMVRNRLQIPFAKGAIILIDLNEFKQVNDQHGHLVGDQILKEVSARIKNVLRPTDQIGRIGGDEFMLFLRNADSALDVKHIMKYVYDAFSTPIQLRDQEFNIDFEMGYALIKKERSFEELFEKADRHMYMSKRFNKVVDQKPI